MMACAGYDAGRWISIIVFISMMQAAILISFQAQAVELRDAPQRALGHRPAQLHITSRLRVEEQPELIGCGLVQDVRSAA